MGSARYHFSGIAGAGMNPLALVMRSRGHEVQGSDRSFDRGENAEVERRLRRAGVAIAGTSGKSTVTGMLAWILRSADVDATVIGGAALVGEGSGGCFAAG